MANRFLYAAFGHANISMLFWPQPVRRVDAKKGAALGVKAVTTACRGDQGLESRAAAINLTQDVVYTV